MFLNLVRQRTKNICSASNDQGENPQNPAKNPQNSRKNPQKNAKTRKSWNHVVLVIFGFFLEFQKFFTVCVHGRSAEIFTETYMFGTKWIIFWVIWPIFLELPFFPRQWRVEVFLSIQTCLIFRYPSAGLNSRKTWVYCQWNCHPILVGVIFPFSTEYTYYDLPCASSTCKFFIPSWKHCVYIPEYQNIVFFSKTPSFLTVLCFERAFDKLVKIWWFTVDWLALACPRCLLEGTHPSTNLILPWWTNSNASVWCGCGQCCVGYHWK